MQDGSSEIFDFSEEVLNFVKEEKAIIPSVSLPTIDKMTSSFSNRHDFMTYISDKTNLPNSTKSKLSIRYQDKFGLKRHYTPVWNDDTLQEIASNTKDNKIDLTNEKTKEVFMMLYEELVSNGSRFAAKLLTTGYAELDAGFNPWQRKVLHKMNRCALGEEEGNVLQEFAKNFSKYRDFRGLYLRHKNRTRLIKKEKQVELKKNPN